MSTQTRDKVPLSLHSVANAFFDLALTHHLDVHCQTEKDIAIWNQFAEMIDRKSFGFTPTNHPGSGDQNASEAKPEAKFSGKVLKIRQIEEYTFYDVTEEQAKNPEAFFTNLNNPVAEAGEYEVPSREFQVWDNGKLIEG